MGHFRCFNRRLVNSSLLTHRAFIAIDLPPSARQEVVSLQSRLDKLNLPIICEPPQKLHLTLNFLGRLTDSQLHQVSSQITRVSKKFNSMSIQPVFLESLYRRHDASLIYLSAHHPQIVSLQKALSVSLSQISLPQPRRFLPHITIASLKKLDPITTKKVLGQISELDFSPLSPFEVDHLTLYESLLSRSGSTYQKIRHFMLQ